MADKQVRVINEASRTEAKDKANAQLQAEADWRVVSADLVVNANGEDRYVISLAKIR